MKCEIWLRFWSCSHLSRHRKRNSQTVYFNVVSWVPVITSFLFLLPQLYPTFHLLFRSASRSLSDPYPTSFRTKQDGDSGIIGVGEWSGGPGGLIILGSRGHSVTATLMLARRSRWRTSLAIRQLPYPCGSSWPPSFSCLLGCCIESSYRSVGHVPMF